jgi:serine/threonine-protein kinase
MSQRVKLLRDALSDDARQPRYIEVVHGLGYRLIPDVQPTTRDTLPVRRNRNWWLLSGAIVALVLLIGIYLRLSDFSPAPGPAEPRSVAALPFENLSPDPDHAYFAASIHNDILARLAMISTLKVVSRTSVLEYQGTTKNLQAISKELGVDAILEGTVHRVGDNVRINVQLVDAKSDEHLWAQLYDRELTAQNIFAIQTEMATAIAQALKATLSSEEAARLSEIPTRNMKAYDYYLAGTNYRNQVAKRRFLPLASQMYEQAVREDPEFVSAWAALSYVHSLMFLFSIDRTSGRLEQALAAVERAFSLSPDSPEAHLAMGYYFMIGARDSDGALREFAIAERSIPGDMEIYRARGLIYRRIGERQKAVTNLGRAVELDPRNADLLRQVVITFLNLREYDITERYLDRMAELTQTAEIVRLVRASIPLHRDGDVSAMAAVAEEGRTELAGVWRDHAWRVAIYQRDYVKALRRIDAWSTGVNVSTAIYIPKASYYGVTYLLAGQPELAKAEFQRARAQLEKALQSDPRDDRLYVSLAEAMAGLGEPTAATDLVRRAMATTPKSEDMLAGPYVLIESIMRALTLAGEWTFAIDMLDNYLSGPGHWTIEGLLPDPRLDPIREDPRFLALVEKYRRE